jgi:hypothetical protein
MGVLFFVFPCREQPFNLGEAVGLGFPLGRK